MEHFELTLFRVAVIVACEPECAKQPSAAFYDML